MKKFAVLVSLIVALTGSAVLPSVAIAWASAGQATVHPGVQVFTKGAQCTSNFVYEEGSGGLPRPGGTLLRHGRPDRNRRLHQPLAAARHAR